MRLVCFAVVLYIILLTGYHTGGAMSSAYAKYPARYLFVPRSSARINTGRGCPLLPVIFVSPRYAAVRCIAAGCAVYVLSAVLDIGGDNAMNCYRQGLCASVNCAAYCRRLCNAPVGFRMDIPAETDLTARPPRHSRCRTLAPGCRRSASRCRRGRRAQSRARGPRRRGRYKSRTGRCSSGRR